MAYSYRLIVLIAFFPIIVSAKTWVLPSGVLYEEISTAKSRVFTLPSGLLFAVAEAEELSPKEEIKMYAAEMANKYGISWKTFDFVIRNESGYEPFPAGSNDNGNACGILQYWKKTHARHKAEAVEEGFNFDDFKYCSWKTDLELGAWAISDGKGNEWSCYRRYKGDLRYCK